MTNHSIALHGLKFLLSYLSPITLLYDCNLPWGNDLNFNLSYLSMLPYNQYKPQNAFFFFLFWWLLPHLHCYSLRLILLSHREHMLIMSLDHSCEYGTGTRKKKKDGDVRLSKRLGFELQYHPLNKEAHFSYVHVFYYTKYSYLI